MTTKALSGRQARWAETLSWFNFMLTDQEMDSQMAMKISTRTQTLLQPANLDPRIVTDLDLDPLGTDIGFEVDRSQLTTLGAEVATVNSSSRTHDLIDDLLQANRTSLDLALLY
ncbi:hypothetical protein VE00_10905 [Pseudogymnoascus sp. WSF 3629]|nr:hypothetical protein VE00_10905 [Pseudogymnoascus sp. WSF 3629]